MGYRVELTDRAVCDLGLLYVEKNAAESMAAARWFNGLEEAVDSLATYPLRCAPAPESKTSRRPLQHLLYGKKPHVYRVIFEVHEQSKMVMVLTIRHGAMEAMPPEEFA